MIIQVRTMLHHAHNADGTPRTKHCCGCWTVGFDVDEPAKPWMQCNECGETRVAKFDGIEQEQ